MKTILTIFLAFILALSPTQATFAKKKVVTDERKLYLTNFNHLNITNDSTKNMKALKRLIETKKPKAIYLEQWITMEPNKANVWKDDQSIKVQILNLMLDSYSAIHAEAKKRNKTFIAEFPFWLSDFKGPHGTFSEDACKYTDKIIFLIDDPEKLDKLDIPWHDVTCVYSIDITKRATNQTEDSVRETYYKLKEKLTLYSNFIGYIIDSDSTIEEDI